MSDGPHKSLGMRRAWKRLAKVADNPNSTDEEIRECLIDAHQKDWQKENCAATVKRIQAIVCEEQQPMFSNVTVERLEALRASAGGFPMAMLILDCVIESVSSGNSGDSAVTDGVRQAQQEWSVRHSREIEEHYRRESTDWRASRLRDRYEATVEHTDFNGLADSMIDRSRPHEAFVPRKRTALDDGVSR